MGLDWLLERRKPKKGAEAKFKALQEKMHALEAQDAPSSEEAQAALLLQLDALSLRAEDDIGAPRIGIDDDATRWCFSTKARR
ncbi:MAG: hypothetical protein K1X64_02185 [Myxococcaceae bacterium]|nr:hypothetical protein [Myxococcaceae bacterium]